MRKLIRVLAGMLLLTSVAFLEGCGGNLGAPSGELTRAVAFNIQWVPQTGKKVLSRDAVAPLDSNIAIITLPGAATDGSDVIITAVRDTAAKAGAIQTYFPPVPVKVGTRSVVAEFYADASKNNFLAQINTNLTVGTNGGSVTFSTAQQPDNIVITPGQSLRVRNYSGEVPYRLRFVATSGQGTAQQTMAINPTYVKIQVTDGSSVVQVVDNPYEKIIPYPKDSLQGLQTGTAKVTVSVGTVTSKEEQVAVTSTTRITPTPQQIGQDGNVTGGLTYSFDAVVTPPADAVAQNINFQIGNQFKTIDSNRMVRWSVQEGVGTIIPIPDFDHPNKIAYLTPVKSGTYHLLATSVYDPGILVTVPVKVTLGTVDISFQ